MIELLVVIGRGRKMKSLIGWNAILLFAGTLWGAEPVNFSPGDDVEQMVQTNPPGTIFLFAPGVYRLQQIVPRNDDQFFGSPGAILTGARVLNPVQQGAYWVATGQTQQGQVHGMCDSTHPRCMYPEDLFLDNSPLFHVASKDQVGPGKWFFDYAADTIYMGDNPTGHVVETSVARSAFSGSASRVVISGLIIEKYAIPPQMGAVGDQSPGDAWIVLNNEIRWNHGAGVNVANGALVANNYIHHNGQMGMAGHGSSLVFSNNEVSFNNWAGFDAGWEAGGAKFAQTVNLTVTRNRSHDNNGLGLWTDIDNIGTLYDGNVLINNDGGGISHEISYRAVIRNNVLISNGPPTCSWLWGGQIQVQNSRDVEIYGNTVTVGTSGCGNGIVLVEQYRGTGAYGPYVVSNAYVHNNVITCLGANGTTGAVQDTNNPDIFGLGYSNRFNANTYFVPDITKARWAWANSYRTWSEFLGFGHEAQGTVMPLSVAPLKVPK